MRVQNGSVTELTALGRAMYQILVSFTVRPEHRDDFVRAAQKTRRDSLANEPGSHRFEALVDEENADLFYLNEVYADVAAFDAHAGGPSFAAFFAEVSAYVEGPTWLMRGNLIPDKDEV
ncbi:putative quinol monooxygenase [Streptomyces sp. NPDC006923]|uniref:putative quinol monooxygenase n=1 Tax=Streptomyces sp. NPDC006923 TaxID=3155355 RepID=UPI0033FAD9CF